MKNKKILPDSDLDVTLGSHKDESTQPPENIFVIFVLKNSQCFS